MREELPSLQEMDLIAPGAAASLKRSVRIQRSMGTNLNSCHQPCASKDEISNFIYRKAIAAVLRLG